MTKFHSVIDEPIEEESYFVSMTDMMVGLLFIFILMLMYFALQYQSTTENLKNAEDTRGEIIREIVQYLRTHDVPISDDDIDLESGVLHLPENILRFPSGKDEIEARYEPVVKSLAEAMEIFLPCYSKGNSPRPEDCPETVHSLESVFIEGHTDSDVFNGAGGRDYNWELSTNRAVNTYRKLIRLEPDLTGLNNNKDEHLISVSGYGSKRPIVDNDTDDHKRRNRRIDLRFIMATPEPSGALGGLTNSIKEEIE